MFDINIVTNQDCKVKCLQLSGLHLMSSKISLSRLSYLTIVIAVVLVNVIFGRKFVNGNMLEYSVYHEFL